MRKVGITSCDDVPVSTSRKCSDCRCKLGAPSIDGYERYSRCPVLNTRDYWRTRK